MCFTLPVFIRWIPSGGSIWFHWSPKFRSQSQWNPDETQHHVYSKNLSNVPSDCVPVPDRSVIWAPDTRCRDLVGKPEQAMHPRSYHWWCGERLAATQCRLMIGYLHARQKSSRATTRRHPPNVRLGAIGSGCCFERFGADVLYLFVHTRLLFALSGERQVCYTRPGSGGERCESLNAESRQVPGCNTSLTATFYPITWLLCESRILPFSVYKFS